MTNFKNLKVNFNKDELNNIIQRYKKAKKYMRSPIYQIKKMDGNEVYISRLIEESKEDPPID